MQFPSHGANYRALYKNFGIMEPEDVVDLSENINFLGPMKELEEAWPKLYKTLFSYPDPNAEPLRSLIANKHKVHKEQILVGNGAAELITLFAQRLVGKRVILVHPTFSEYKQTLLAAGAILEELVIKDVLNYQLPMEDIKHAMKNASCFYLCNPNNPTGTLVTKDVLEELIRHGQEVGCELLIDEAFMDWTNEENSVVDLVTNHHHLTVLRSMTKMYSIAGIRLGYLISSSEIVSEMKTKLPHWNVNALAIQIGQMCIKDNAFRQGSIKTVLTIKNDIQNFLESRGCSLVNSVANFLCFQLAEPDRTREFYFYCLERGIVLRHTENYVGLDGRWLRIGIKSKDAMNKFKKVMDDWIG